MLEVSTSIFKDTRTPTGLLPFLTLKLILNLTAGLIIYKSKVDTLEPFQHPVIDIIINLNS